ncbi:MAG: hypothetical protein AAFY01_08160 [Pseudomonadota bacterium]
MTNIVNLPLDRITDRDRTRLFQAAAGSPLDIDVVTNEDGTPCVLVYRCGWTHPSFRIEKTAGLWKAFDLEHGNEQPAFQSRMLTDLVAALSYPEEQQNRPTAS